MTPPRRPLTAWQQTLADELREISRNVEMPLTVNEQRGVGPHGMLPVLVTLETSEIYVADGGLPLLPREPVEIWIPPTSATPPAVIVRHDRFLGYPHVLVGRELCIFLDPAREWDPAGAGRALLARLWTWLEDAAGARFSASDALYHATGGVPVGGNADEVLVVRDEIPLRAARLWGYRRSKRRLDVGRRFAEDAIAVAYWPCAVPLPLNIGQTVGDLLDAVTRGGATTADAVIGGLRAQLARNASGQEHLYFLLSVPHPAGGPSQLIGGRLGPEARADLEIGAATLRTRSVDWCAVSDERSAVTTRRDIDTPTSGFLGAHVSILGCGALGSWIAEFVARAGTSSLLLMDPYSILSGGLLVRQNYVEDDVGETKSTALAKRVRLISDGVAVVDGAVAPTKEQEETFRRSHFVIDATANVAASHQLDLALGRDQPQGAVIARVATDPSSSTRGLAIIAGRGETRPLDILDGKAGEEVGARPELEDFRPFWSRRAPNRQVVPTRGCSIPTFHGSAADVAAIAAIMVRLLGRHRDNAATGAHLFQLPGTGTPAEAWLAL